MHGITFTRQVRQQADRRLPVVAQCVHTGLDQGHTVIPGSGGVCRQQPGHLFVGANRARKLLPAELQALALGFEQVLAVLCQQSGIFVGASGSPTARHQAIGQGLDHCSITFAGHVPHLGQAQAAQGLDLFVRRHLETIGRKRMAHPAHVELNKHAFSQVRDIDEF